MMFQPLNFLEGRSVFFQNIEESSYKSCPGNLTIFSIEKMPNFYIFLESEILSNDFDVIFSDPETGNVIYTESILLTSVKKANVANGVFYFFNDLPSSLPTAGVYQFAIGYTAQDTNDYFEIFDVHKFVETPEDCYYKMTFFQGCNINKIPFVRCPEFKFEFYFPKDSGYLPASPIYEAEYEDNKEGQDESVYKRMLLEQEFRAMNISQALYNSIVYGAIFNDYDITFNGEETDKIRNIQFESPVFIGCCVFNFSIKIIRSYIQNDGCCEEVILTDCMEYVTQEVESIQDDSQEPTSDNNLCWLIEDDIVNAPTEWTGHIGEVACGNGDSTWTYSQPEVVFVKDSNSYLIFNGVGYDDINIIGGVSVIPALPAPIPGLKRFLVSGAVFDDYEVCLFRSYNGSGFDPQDFTLIGTYSESQFESGIEFQVSNCPLAGCGSPESMNLKALFKRAGCKDTLYSYPFALII